MDEEVMRVRAGLLRQGENSSLLTPDTRKGELLVLIDGDTELPKIIWREREQSPAKVEIESIAVPGECALRRVGDQSKRCVELYFPEEPDRNVCFWMQYSGNIDTDNSVVSQFNNALKQENNTRNHELSERQGQQQPGNALADALNKALQNASTGADQMAALQHEPSLSEVITPELAREYLIARDDIHPLLAEFLPESQKSKRDVDELIRSPQFQQQLDRLSRLLRSGEFDISQFGLDAQSAGAGVINFLEALQQHANSQKESRQQQQQQQQ